MYPCLSEAEGEQNLDINVNEKTVNFEVEADGSGRIMNHKKFNKTWNRAYCPKLK